MALTRVLTLLARRRCAVEAVDFLSADRHRPGRLRLTLTVPAGREHQVVRWLSTLVDVLLVQVRASAP